MLARRVLFELRISPRTEERPVITDKMAKLLIEQVGSELRAHQIYIAIATYFDRQSLTRWAKLFKDQSVEEAGHATKIMDFLTDNEVAYDLPALKAAKTRYASAAAAVQTALDSERAVTRSFGEMATAAIAANDHTAHQFLLWFIEEQVEEERKAQALLDLVNSGINLFQAEDLLDRFE
jgi:ferritin